LVYDELVLRASLHCGVFSLRFGCDLDGLQRLVDAHSHQPRDGDRIALGRSFDDRGGNCVADAGGLRFRDRDADSDARTDGDADRTSFSDTNGDRNAGSRRKRVRHRDE
jgi:hypothetical protein